VKSAKPITLDKSIKQQETVIPFTDTSSGYFWIGNRPSTNVFVPFYYHKYLQVADLQHLSPSQIHNLELEGCFQVPSQSVLNEFIRQYFIYVHPCLPLVNERTFWSIYSRTDNVQRKTSFFSLALFQAMLFAATRVRQLDARLSRI
jgi:hypothetical protein